MAEIEKAIVEELETPEAEEVDVELETDTENTPMEELAEAADDFYHLIIYLEKSGIKIEDVMKELNNRRK